MVTAKDIELLGEWAQNGDAPGKVRTWHAQIIVELVEYIRYLESELCETRHASLEQEEELRLLKHLPSIVSTSLASLS